MNCTKKITRAKDGERIDLVLVGNKADLPEQQHEISYKMGKQLADNLGCPFVETSAKTGVNVNEAFELIVREMKKDKGAANASADGKDGKKNDDASSSCCIIM